MICPHCRQDIKPVRKSRHRLAVGDCTDKDVVDAVMMGEKAGAVVTDPPYGIEQEGILNDDPEGLRNLYDGCLAVLPIDNAVVITFQSPRLFWVWLDAVRSAAHKIGRLLWLYKTGQPRIPWHGWYMHGDAILVSLVGNPKWPDWTDACPDTYEVNIHDDQSVYGTQVGDQALHSAIKPWGVIENLIAHTQGIVFDPFVGSGTTIIGCERLRRQCRVIEIDPGYCAVAIQRWVDVTGREPELILT